MKRFFLLVCLTIFALSLFGSVQPAGTAFAGEAEDHTGGDTLLLEKGDRSILLDEAKARLYELGYFENDDFTYSYMARTEVAVMEFQERNGLPITGYITSRDWNVLFSDQAIPYSAENSAEETPKALSETPAADETPVATATPTVAITSEPTSEPTPEPTPEPTSEPTSEPTPEPIPSPAPTPCLVEETDPAATETPEPAVLFRIGDKGDYLLTVKQRLYELGYFTDTGFAQKYTEQTRKAVSLFQETNGLPVTGVYSEQDDAVLFSEEARPAPTPTPIPTSSPIPSARPFLSDNQPTRDAEGYLLGEGEYVYENDEAGQWVYLSRDIQVIINRYEDTSIPLVWFESEILLRNGEKLQAVHIEGNDSGRNMRFCTPQELAEEKQLLFAFTDDFYDYRVYHGETVGVVIRNGEIKYNKTYKERSNKLPNLDMMAQFPDGSLKCYRVGDVSAEELLAAGAEQVYCFGPVVVSDGLIDTILSPTNFAQKFPRQFLGMIEPNHYLVLTVLGRTSTSEGIGCLDAAQMLIQRGVTEALNLDGGNTMAIVFRGRMLNEKASWKTRKYVRSVSSLIGVGHWEAAPSEEDAE